MDTQGLELFNKLDASLEGLIKVYRSLLGVVRREKEILVSADLDDLNENNKAKEAMLIKIRALEQTRIRYTAEIADHEGLDQETTRLLNLAVHFGGERGDKLRNLQSVLSLLLKRVHEHNQQNEVLIKSGLENITGAMRAIRDTLQDKPTYHKKGEIQSQPTESGQLVSREA